MEHVWMNIYGGSGVEECMNCSMQRRPESPPHVPNSGRWQFRASASSPVWGYHIITGALPLPCKGADGQQFKQTPPERKNVDPDLTLRFASKTEELEAELKRCSETIENHQFWFHQVREELKRRRETSDEQPVPLTKEQQAAKNAELQTKLDNNLILKITAMETEQAKLVIEAETAKAAQREAESRLALVVKAYVERGLIKDATTAVDAVIAAEATTRRALFAELGAAAAVQVPTERVVLEEIARHHRSMSDYIAEPGEAAGDKISKK